jgi:hypothetical protein
MDGALFEILLPNFILAYSGFSLLQTKSNDKSFSLNEEWLDNLF